MEKTLIVYRQLTTVRGQKIWRGTYNIHKLKYKHLKNKETFVNNEKT